MVTLSVHIQTMQDAIRLTELAAELPCDVDLLWGRYLVDAKSVLGVLSLPQFEQAKLYVHTKTCGDFIKKLQAEHLLAV